MEKEQDNIEPLIFLWNMYITKKYYIKLKKDDFFFFYYDNKN
jgi:hypothetical protein